MRYVPNTVYPFVKRKRETRVVFWKILSSYYDSPGGRFDPQDNLFKYVFTDNPHDELLITLRRYLELGYCPAICMYEDTVHETPGITCSIYVHWFRDNEQ